MDKLAVYQKLGVKEVWFGKNRHFEVYHLRGDEYEKIQQSELLPNLDLSLLADYVQRSDPLEAVLEFRERVRENLGRN
ncbi:Uma2 family endonuclease [Microcoleus sp. Aus8_D1]